MSVLLKKNTENHNTLKNLTLYLQSAKCFTIKCSDNKSCFAANANGTLNSGMVADGCKDDEQSNLTIARNNASPTGGSSNCFIAK